MTWRRGLFAVLAYLALGPVAVRAQSIDLQLRIEGTRAPVPGAIVRVFGPNDKIVVQGLTSDFGRIAWVLASPGTYRIRIDRIGYTGLDLGPLELAIGGEFRREIEMPATRVDLPTLVVHGENQCKAYTREGSLAAALWLESRKALLANILTQESKSVPFHLKLFERDVSRTGTLEKEWVGKSAIVRGQPFASLPAAVLLQRGFVFEDGDESTFAGIDATLLLSDEFIDSHCFNVVEGENGLVGLAFQPPPKRQVPDVQGTLWLDRATSELRHLEFFYTGLHQEIRTLGLGGRVDFQRLSNGGWIVNSWYIRMPRMQLKGRVRLLSGFVDQGGTAVVVAEEGATASRALVVGRIRDSTAGGDAGLAGAIVRVRGQTDSTVTNDDGTFALAVATGGEQTLEVEHPKLTLVPAVTARKFLLSLGDTVRVEFSTPSINAYAETFCGTQAGRARSGLIGRTFGPGGAAQERMSVRVQWEPAAGTSKEERSESGPFGVYVLCDLPPDRTLQVRLLNGAAPLSSAPVTLARGEYRWLDVKP